MTREEGSVCGVDGCAGVFAFSPPDDCRCHLSPPCNACIESLPTCDACGLDVDEAEERSTPRVDQGFLEAVVQGEAEHPEHWRQACRELLDARKLIAELERRDVAREERVRSLTTWKAMVAARVSLDELDAAPRKGDVVRHAASGLHLRVKSIHLVADLLFLPAAGEGELPPLTMVPVAALKKPTAETTQPSSTESNGGNK